MKLLITIMLLQVPYISKYLTYREATQTSVSVGCTSSANAPDPTQLALIQRFGREFFDPLRVKVKSPLYVNSLFRSKCVNSRVGGARESEHLAINNVVAADIDQDGRNTKIGNRALFFYIRDNMPYRKLIWEFGTTNSPAWVHVSWSPDPKMNIRKSYRATKIGNRTVYTIFNPYE
jgi:hypothetical protein